MALYPASIRARARNSLHRAAEGAPPGPVPGRDRIAQQHAKGEVARGAGQRQLPGPTVVDAYQRPLVVHIGAVGVLALAGPLVHPMKQKPPSPGRVSQEEDACVEAEGVRCDG
eukprot:CAMPEP_0117670752 /NCGR_PEP_ID=MMETSP0804-20121206/12947_1 /TAXON_ID=1074897 /ORGANISM="Tetraselmis astigmatica, Strain CCMP880" /LENGTH=112 /DNA_ID=CAMNT_0005479125 /DNA_START=849 /DNA_END=1188 /DNA_ORIENTATION=-